MELLRSIASEHASDITKIDEYLEELSDQLEESITNSILEKSGYATLKDYEYRTDRFIANLNIRWFESFDLLRLFNIISYEISESIAYNGAKYCTEDKKTTFKLLLKLHARAIKTSQEILVLITNGFADGALARWRTLHELSVIFLFIAKNGEGTAQRYLEYSVVEQRKKIKAYSCTAQCLSFEKISEEDQQRIENSVKSLKDKYGNKFTEEFGWTNNIIPNNRIYLNDLEKNVELDELHAFYKFACDPIHAGVNGTLFSLGDLNEPNMTFSISGASNVGFTEPGQLTAYSLLKINKALVECFDSIDSRIGIKVLESFFTDLKVLLVETQNSIEREKAD